MIGPPPYHPSGGLTTTGITFIVLIGLFTFSEWKSGTGSIEFKNMTLFSSVQLHYSKPFRSEFEDYF